MGKNKVETEINRIAEEAKADINRDCDKLLVDFARAFVKVNNAKKGN